MSEPLRCRIAALIGLSAVMLSASAAAQPVIGTNQRTLVICVRYSDALTTRLANCSDWVAVLNGQTNTFYTRATFNQTTFQFETVSAGGTAPANGWFDLGYAAASYNFFTTGQDAINLADPFVNFANYKRVVVISSWPDFGGQGGGPWGWTVGEGGEWTENISGSTVNRRAMTMSIINEWHAHDFGNTFDEAGSVVGHELGHHLGAPTHYGGLNFPPDVGRDTITPWDIMGLSPGYSHFLGYAKVDRGWIPDAAPRTTTVGPPVGASIDTTIALAPLENLTAGAQVLRVPLTGGTPFVGYMVENRRRLNGDELLPAEGVLLTAVDQNPSTIIRAYVVDNPTAPGNLNAAPLAVGQSYVDAAHNLTITNVSAAGNNFNVRVQYGLPPGSHPDPMITPWGAPPWETADIWIDSSKNGFGTYRYHDGSGAPTGNGDDAWINHDNRLYMRVHNIGPGTATNVRVQAYVNSPPGMGDAGPNWDYLGTIVFPSIAAGASALSFVNWRPTVAAHTCVKAVIVNQPDELSTSNNVAQENVTAFDTSSSSPYHPVVLKANVFNPYDDRELPIHINVRDVPRGWGIMLDKDNFVLPKGGKDDVTLTVFPSGLPPTDKASDNLRPGFIGKPKIEAQMPWADTWIPIGGIDVWTHITRKPTLTCQVRGTRPARPGMLSPDVGGLGMPKAPAFVNRGKIGPGKPLPLDPTKIGQWTTITPPTAPPPSITSPDVVIEGTLAPAGAGQTIAVELTQGGRSVLVHAKTDASGHYVARHRADATGLWRVQTFFAGDESLAAVDSNFCSFQLVKGK